MSKRSWFFWLVACLAVGRPSRARDLNEPTVANGSRVAGPEIFDRYELETETGMLWKLGGGATPLSYTFLPQLITLKTPAVAHWTLGGGNLVMRSRYTLLLEPIIRGPEHYFVGLSASGALEWWSPSRQLCLFFASGGGAGIMHSRGYEIRGGQGEDLNLTWLIYSGARYQFSETMNASCGVYFQHISNGGMDRVNPGVNALGPMISLGWKF